VKDENLKNDLYEIFNKAETYSLIFAEYKRVIEDDLREVCPDLAMIAICQMSPAEYFLYLKKVDMSLLDDVSQTKVLRIGMICRWYIEHADPKVKIFSEDKCNEKEDFVKLYTQTFAADKPICEQKQAALEHWARFKGVYDRFRKNFGHFMPIIKSILSSTQERFKGFTDSIDKNDFIEYYYKKYIDGLKSDGRNSDLVFQNDINCILKMQKQDGLRSYNVKIQGIQKKYTHKEQDYEDAKEKLRIIREYCINCANIETNDLIVRMLESSRYRVKDWKDFFDKIGFVNKNVFSILTKASKM